MAHHLVLYVAIVAVLAPCASAYYPWPVCGNSSFAATSKYLANINLLASSLPRNTSTSPSLFATAEAGAAPDKVWARALCSGDSNSTSCFSCLTQAFSDLPNVCNSSMQATMYYDSCMLHYSNASKDPVPDVPYTYFDYRNATSETGQFNSLVAKLVNATADYAAYNSTRRFASGEADFDLEFPKLYSWAQCTPDLTPARCRECLALLAMANLPGFEDCAGGAALTLTCSFRYQTYSFSDGPVMVRLPGPAPLPRTGSPAPAPAPAPVPTVLNLPATTTRGEKYSVPGMVLIVLLPTIAAINLVACFFFWRRPRPQAKAKQPNPSYFSEAEDTEGIGSTFIGIAALRAATDNFAECNKLGEGGFGAVYKGTLPDGKEIAVKRLSESSKQGVEELKNELSSVANLEHKNLVTLLGVCLEQQERLLVYEFVPNGSLDRILFADAERRKQLDWGKRYEIINGIALGLQYLHENTELKVVHRDLKASNILLDADMNPMISDFGIARIFEQDQTQGVTNHVVGTNGYMAPEYVMRGNYSVKSDSFSFGVLVLEIVTGRKNNHKSRPEAPDLLAAVWERWTAGTVLDMMDRSLSSSFSESGVLRCIHVGLLCVQENPADRPLMSSVLVMLGSGTVPLSPPSKPAFYAN